jgi:hypothetical protein
MKKTSQAKIAYAGYGVCALTVALFESQLVANGTDIYMMVGVFLVPLAAGAAIAMSFSWGVNSKLLRTLGVLTAAMGLFLIGDGNFMLPIQIAVLSAYIALVLLACLLGWREWWPSA